MHNHREQLEDLVLGTTVPSDQTDQRRIAIRNTLLGRSAHLKSPQFEKVGAVDLRLLMDEYDRRFFKELCQATLKENGDELSFRVSTRMTSTGGKTSVEYRNRRTGQRRASKVASGKRPSTASHIARFSTKQANYPPRDFEIAISATLLFESFATHAPAAQVAGVACQDRLDALQRIFEHELVHLIEFLVWNDSSCAGKRFRQIARFHFGHHQSNHQLITPSESAELKQGIGIGDVVAFVHDGHQFRGYINHINRRATVLVPDKNGAKYTDGKRYAKYYVPLSKLKKTD